MRGFSDLPKDVMWIIFLKSFKMDVLSRYSRWDYFIRFNSISCGISNIFNGPSGCALMRYALLNRKSLEVVKSKCVKLQGGWLFKRGVLSENGEEIE